MLVVKIGGCNGSGKSSIVAAVLQAGNFASHEVSGKKTLAYKAGNMYVLGDYTNACGGMDTITDKDVRLALLKKYAARNNVVFFEGLVASKAYGDTGRLATSQKGHWLYAFVDTPFDICVERVLQRRKNAGNDKPFDPERTMRETYHVYELRQQAALAEGHRVLVLNHKKTPKQLAQQLFKEVERLA